jgi:hypothetical protein
MTGRLPPSARTREEGDSAMAKGRDKGGREAKKPKADKKTTIQPPPAPPRPMPVATKQGPKTVKG